MAAMPGIDTISEIDFGLDAVTARPWKVILWNDEINDIVWVVESLSAVLEISSDAAWHLATRADDKMGEGRSVVADGDRDRCQSVASRLGARGLTTSVESDGGQ